MQTNIFDLIDNIYKNKSYFKNKKLLFLSFYKNKFYITLLCTLEKLSFNKMGD